MMKKIIAVILLFAFLLGISYLPVQIHKCDSTNHTEVYFGFKEHKCECGDDSGIVKDCCHTIHKTIKVEDNYKHIEKHNINLTKILIAEFNIGIEIYNSIPTICFKNKLYKPPIIHNDYISLLHHLKC